MTRNLTLVVASIAALLLLPVPARAQDQTAPSGKTNKTVPDAPQPQKKQNPPAAGDAPPTYPAPTKSDKDQPAPPAGKDANAFPEAVSRAAAKAQGSEGDDAPAQAPASGKHPTGDDNPFPEAVSREAAKQAGQDQTPIPPRTDLPPGVSSSQSSSSLDGPAGAAGEGAVNDPARASKDNDVGSYYLKAGDWEGALLRYKDATASDPTNVESIFGLAEAERLLKKKAEAAQYYQMYLEIVPNGPHAKQAIKELKALQPGK